MHQLDRIALNDGDVPQPRPSYDAGVMFDNNGPRIEIELLQKLEQRRAVRYLFALSIDHNIHSRILYTLSLHAALPHLAHAIRTDAADGYHRKVTGSGDDLFETRQPDRRPAGVRGGHEHRPYNKIVSPCGPCGFRLGQIMDRLTDPPQRVERARGANGQAAVAELHTGRWDCKRDVQTVVHNQHRRKDGKTEREIVMLETRELAPAGVNGEIGAAAIRQGAGDRIEVRPPGNTLIGDCMQPRQHRSHVNLTPGFRRAPRSHSAVGMRAFPAGCTSKISTLPPAVSLNGPVAMTSEPSAESTSPGAQVPGKGGSMTLGLNSLISAPPPFSSVHAPGRGSSPRMRLPIARASLVQSMRAVSRVSLGANVARLSFCGTGCGGGSLCSSIVSVSISACAPTSARWADNSPPVTSDPMRWGIWCSTGPESIPASSCMIVTPVVSWPRMMAHSTGAAPRRPGKSDGCTLTMPRGGSASSSGLRMWP